MFRILQERERLFWQKNAAVPVVQRQMRMDLVFLEEFDFLAERSEAECVADEIRLAAGYREVGRL